VIRTERGDLDGAQADLDQALRLDPAAPETFLARSDLWRIRGAIVRAEADARTAIRLDPRSAPAYVRRAAARRERGDLDHALADAESAIRLDPRLADAYLGRSAVRRARGDSPGALADVAEALRREPNWAPAFAARAALRPDSAGALADADWAIKLDPGCAAGHERRALILAAAPDPALRDRAGAIAAARRACELTGWHRAGPIAALAAAEAEGGAFAAAIDWQGRALELLPTDGPDRPAILARLALYRARAPYRLGVLVPATIRVTDAAAAAGPGDATGRGGVGAAGPAR